MNLVSISELFDIEYGNSLELNRLEISESETAINFVSRTAKNNGVSARVLKFGNERVFEAGLITVSVGGSVLETFLQSFPFYTGYHVMVLKPKKYMTEIEKLYYCTCIKKNKYRYNYGRQANRTLKSIKIPSEIPDWVYNIKSDIPEDFTKSILPLTFKLDSLKWQSFRYDALFNLGKGERIVNKDMREGNTPCIRPIESNNGVYDFIDLNPNHEGNSITVNYNGSVAEAFYQPVPYFALDDVNVLYPKFDLNPFIAMFLITLIRKEKFRFNYGRKWHLGRMRESTIKLPVTPEGNPDWDFMEKYIKSLPYSKSLAV
jgi:hypothetical protein